MNMAIKNTVSLIDDDEILALCREDKSCFVDENWVVYTSDPKSDNLNKIITKVKIQLHGKEPNINLADSEVVLNALQVGSTLSVETIQKSTKNATNVAPTQVEDRLMGLLARCIRMGGSDIHILVKGKKTIIKCRIDGRLVDISAPQTKEYGAELTAYVFNGHSGSEESYSPLIPNAGSFSKVIAVNNVQKAWDWRTSMLPVSSSSDDKDCTKTVLRLLTPIRDDIPSFADMGMDEDHIEIIESAFKQAHGAILFSGPTGSGKTTVAMAGLSTIDDGRNINTLEDPPEWTLDGVSQTRIDYGLTKKGKERDFAYYGKVMLRQDPDVIYFGEVRDQKSAAEFTHLSESGHLLIGTTHTSSATGIATKLVEHLRVPSVIASSPDVFSVFAHQRLIRVLCPHCSIPYKNATEEQQATLRRALGDDLGLARVKNSNGCNKCVEGEKGRTLVMEVIVLTDDDRKFIAKGDALAWKIHLLNNGWKNIQHYALKKVRSGVCDIHSAAEQIKDLL
ncbi:GspE/PulE family protein [Aeromonas hydrophila]|uniref:GspE/PulE family protein n=1 Tax=Aeromonas hydrophila TaxID=644 RepID=UPI003EC51962